MKPLKIESRDILLIPINNNHFCDIGDGGTHWSRLIYSKLQKLFYHCDSLGSVNLSDAQTDANKLGDFLGRPTSISTKIVNLSGPIQNNSYDCGIYHLVIAVKGILSSNA